MAPRARGIGKSVHSSAQQAFCELMVQARRKSGLTQQQLADRLRKPQSFVAKYEGGERRLDVVEFVEVMRAMEADPVKTLKVLVGKTA
jgi:ribosome-binding protein aMBF1 (putative translation factor)